MSDDKTVTAVILAVDKEESWRVDYRPFLTDMMFMAIAKVESIEIIPSPDFPGKKQIDVSCKALDSFGFVFNLHTVFMRETEESTEKIETDLDIDSIYGWHNVVNQIASLFSRQSQHLTGSISEMGHFPRAAEFGCKTCLHTVA